MPDEGSLLRHWHHVAVWDPSSGPEGLKALRELHPDAAMAPAPGLREVWPKDVPTLAAGQADHEAHYWGLPGHIDAIEGREPEPAEESGPEPEEPRNGGPSLDPF